MQLPKRTSSPRGSKLTYYQLALLAAAVFLSSAVIVWAMLFFWQQLHQVPTSPTTTQTVQIEPSPTPDPLRPFAIALLGYGGAGHQGGGLSDTIIVALISPRTATIHLISIPRDSWVELPTGRDGTTQDWKVNAALALGADDAQYPGKPPQFTGTQGGIELAKFALTQITGLPIEHVVAVDFAGFVEAIDAVGGITVTVDMTFDDSWYPIAGLEGETCGRSPEDIAALTSTMSAQVLEQQFPCRYEQLHFEKGKQTMDGATALKYVRSRHSSQDGSDFGRSTRQRKVILALKEKVFQIQFLPKAPSFISKLARNMQTDLQLADWQEYLAQANELRQYQIENIALSTQNVLSNGKSSSGQFILLPTESSRSATLDWRPVHTWLQNEIARTSTPSAELKK